MYLLTPLDREQKDLLHLQVYAEDHGLPQHVTMTTLDIAVEDINDNAPVFYDTDMNIISDISVNVLEKSPVGSPIYVPHAVDKDLGDNADISYRLSGDPRVVSYFDIDSSTGMVTIKKTIDINTIQHDNITTVIDNATVEATLNMQIVAEDHGTPNKSSQLSLDVLVEGINDDAPVFLRSFYEYRVPENQPAGESSLFFSLASRDKCHSPTVRVHLMHEQKL